MAAGAGKTVRLHIGERHRSVVTYQLTTSNESQLAFIVANLQAAKDELAGKIEAVQIDEKL